MKPESPTAMVRCQLGGSAGNNSSRETRFVAAAEFDLWRHFMVTKHERTVTVDEVSVWVPESPEVWDDEIQTEMLEPVVRVRFEKPGPAWTTVPVVRFIPNETFPKAKSALLGHFDPRCRWGVEATPGYFVTSGVNPVHAEEGDFDEDTKEHREVLLHRRRTNLQPSP